MRLISSSFAICLVLCIVASGCRKEDPDRTVKVYSLVGEVRITANNAEKPAAAGDILSPGDRIRTGENSIADILFGTAGIMRIQPATDITIARLMDQATGDTQLDMPSGKLNVTLAKLKKGEFRVKTETAVAAVRGTTFRISAGEKVTRLDVVNGAVKVNPVQNNMVVPTVEKTVEANQTVKLDEKAVKQAVEEKKEIVVAELKPEEKEQIREEVKDIKPEMLEKLNNNARQEVKEKILAPVVPDEREKEKEAEKKKKEEAARLLREKQRRDTELMRRKELEKHKSETQEKKKASPESGEKDNKSVPPSVNTL